MPDPPWDSRPSNAPLGVGRRPRVAVPLPEDPPGADPPRRLRFLPLPPARRRRWGVFLLSLAAVALIGWIDYVTDPDIGFSLLYVLPIMASAWWSGRAAAVSMAVAAAVGWALSDLAGRPNLSLPIHLWNAISRLVIYLFVGVLLARVHRDRTRLKELNHRLVDHLSQETHLARRDYLTGLPNRRAFREGLWVEITRCRRTQQPVCVAYIDIDNFKQVNDLYGHGAGDQMLQQIAAAIGQSIRVHDVAARLGGDEFAILFAAAKAEGPERIAERIVELVDRIGRRSTPAARLGASVGIAYFRSAPDIPDDVMRQADAAMYEAKASGKGRVVLWHQAAEASPAAAG